MSSRSERYLANAEKCQQSADAANTSGTKRLYGVLASQWRQLAEEAEWRRSAMLTSFSRSTRLNAQSESLERFLKASRC
jgi:hypothetical protein